MKTLIFCTSYINNNSDSNNKERYRRWVEFYLERMKYFNSEHLFLIDDGSPDIDNFGNEMDILDPENMPESINKNINLVHFKNNLGRPTWNDYQGWWRSFTFSYKIAQLYDYDKIIHIESDFYITSHKMAEYIKNTTKGWIAPFSRFHGFPETAIQIICKDTYSKLRDLYEEAVKRNFSFDQIAELYIPFTKIEESFLGDRLGQNEILQKWLGFIETPFDLDYFGQLHPKYSFEDYSSIFNFEFL